MFICILCVNLFLILVDMILVILSRILHVYLDFEPASWHNEAITVTLAIVLWGFHPIMRVFNSDAKTLKG